MSRKSIWIAGSFLVLGLSGAFVYMKNERHPISPTSPSPSPSPSESWEIDRIETDNHLDLKQPDYKWDRVYIKGGRKLPDFAYVVHYIGRFDVPNKGPVLLFKGHDCVECEANASLYFYVTFTDKTASVGFPVGEHADDDDEGGSKITYKGRAFYGKCVPGPGPGVVSYWKELQPDGSWKNGTTFYSVEANGSLKTSEINFSEPASAPEGCVPILDNSADY